MKRYLAAAFVILFVFTGCKFIKLKLGIGYMVENPEPGSPEYVMQRVLRAAAIKDPEKSWAAFYPWLHSREREPGAIRTWREMKFPAIRRKVRYYIRDPHTFSYKLKRIKKGLEGTLYLYIYNPNTDVPTPCKFKKDPKANGAWRVFSSCL